MFQHLELGLFFSARCPDLAYHRLAQSRPSGRAPTRPEHFVPLPPSIHREEIHPRRIEMRGYRRADGLYDIEGHITDQKPHVFTLVKGPTRQAHEPIHEMWIILVIDEDFLVHDAIAVSDAAPYRACMAAGLNLQRMKGVSIASGWS